MKPEEPFKRAERQDRKGRKMAKISPVEYLRQVRAEVQKVTWPSKKETIASTIAVFVMVFLAAMFLFLSDQVISFVVKMILSLGM